MADLTVLIVPVQCVVMQKGDGKIERNERETVDREELEERRKGDVRGTEERQGDREESENRRGETERNAEHERQIEDKHGGCEDRRRDRETWNIGKTGKQRST